MLVKGKSVAFDRATWSSIDVCTRNVHPVPPRCRIRVGAKCGAISIRHLHRIGANVVIRRAGSIKRRVWQVAEQHILGERIKEESVAGADNRLPRSQDVPGDSDSWR